MKVQSVNKEELVNDSNNLLEVIRENSTDSGLFELKSEFLSKAFSELISSETFAKYDSDQKKALFTQYEDLGNLLDCLVQFGMKYPMALEVKEIEPGCLVNE